MKIDKLQYLKRHLKTQIKAANKIGSKWVYILTEEAEKCLELAEGEEPVEPDMEGDRYGWFPVCGACHGVIGDQDLYCKHCGQPVLKNETKT